MAIWVVVITGGSLLLTHKPPTVVIAGTPAGTVATGARQAVAGHLPPFWRQRLLAVLGAPRSSENLRLLTAWGIAEGGTAQWNPLNATYVLSYGESWSYNSSLVQNYWRPTGGVAANALTLVQSNYACIVGDLQVSTKTAEEIINHCSAQFRTWGTNPSVMLSVLHS